MTVRPSHSACGTSERTRAVDRRQQCDAAVADREAAADVEPDLRSNYQAGYAQPNMLISDLRS